MSTEKIDPWTLLEEARAVVYEYGPLPEDLAEADLLARIDSALAAHDAALEVAWIPNGKGLDAQVNGYLVEVKPSTDGWWGWKAEQIPMHRDRQHGHKRTKELAQEAAIAAARDQA